MPKYLRKIGTNQIFAYSEYLVKRGDMIPHEGDLNMSMDDVPKSEFEVVKLLNQVNNPDSTKRPTMAETISASKIKDDLPKDIIDSDKKEMMIQKAIADLDKDDFTAMGLPKINALEKVLGFEVTMKERDTAYSNYKELVQVEA